MPEKPTPPRGAATPPEPPRPIAASSSPPQAIASSTPATPVVPTASVAPPRAKSDAPDPLVGRTINGRFKIVALIARGGMGKVYRAEQAPLGRVCAVKVLNPSYAGDQDPEFHKRFFLEASIASKLTHPNTVTIFDYGCTEDDVYFMAMEYLEGLTLHRAIKMSGTLPEARTIFIAAQICRALREAHALGVIHRDLKPANIFLVEHGDDEDFVKVLDFGLVKEMDPKAGDEQLTQTGLFMGSPKYMAPEQIRGEHVDARTDIYSLGVMLYEMLTGKVPFERSTSVNTLMAHVNDPPPAMNVTNPRVTISPGMTEVVMRCLEKEAADRFASMDELLVALKRVVGAPESVLPGATGNYRSISSARSGAFPVAPPTPTPLRTVPPAAPVHSNAPPSLDDDVPQFRKKRTGALAVALVALGVVVGIVARTTMHRSSDSASAATPPDRATTEAVTLPASASAAPPPTALALKSLRVESDPPGASVREDGKELCALTPCVVSYSGDDASRVHRVVLSKAGFRSETRETKAGDAPLSVKLARASGPPPATRAAGEHTPEKTPDGFKEMPY